jgi:hypothetical protein
MERKREKEIRKGRRWDRIEVMAVDKSVCKSEEDGEVGGKLTGPDNLVKETKTRNPNPPPNSCRDLGLDLLVKILSLSLPPDGDAGSSLSILTPSRARPRHGYSKARVQL